MAWNTALASHFTAAFIVFVGLVLTAPTMSVGAIDREHETTLEWNSPVRSQFGEVGVTSALSSDERELVDFALSRFETQGLELPEISFEFFPSTLDCDGHKGMYWHAGRTLRMCSMDEHTLLHEMAHAWANENLTIAERVAFTRQSGLEAWNGHDDAWEDRGTEHAAETIAWGLGDESKHVKWVETLPDGSERVSHRILTLDIDVEMLWHNFKKLTGTEPLFRDDGWWSHDSAAESVSPEMMRAASR